MCPAPILFTCATPYPYGTSRGCPLALDEKGLNGDLGLALLPKAGGTGQESVSSVHQALSGASFAAWGPFPTPPKSSGGFFLTDFQLRFWEGGSPHSRGDALPASAGLLLFLPQVSGDGTCWLQTSGKGVPNASLRCSFVILQVKMLSVSTSAEGFPAQRGDFPARLARCFGGGWVKKKR